MWRGGAPGASRITSIRDILAVGRSIDAPRFDRRRDAAQAVFVDRLVEIGGALRATSLRRRRQRLRGGRSRSISPRLGLHAAGRESASPAASSQRAASSSALRPRCSASWRFIAPSAPARGRRAPCGRARSPSPPARRPARVSPFRSSFAQHVHRHRRHRASTSGRRADQQHDFALGRMGGIVVGQFFRRCRCGIPRSSLVSSRATATSRPGSTSAIAASALGKARRGFEEDQRGSELRPARPALRRAPCPLTAGSRRTGSGRSAGPTASAPSPARSAPGRLVTGMPASRASRTRR